MTTAIEIGHVEPVVVHFDDLDAMGILHNAKYAVLLERALAAYWSRHGFTFADGVPSHPDVLHAVAEYTIRYRAPVRGTGEVKVHFWLDEFGRSNAIYGFRFLSGEDGQTVHAEGRRAIVKLDPATLRPAPWTPAAREVADKLLANAAG